MLSFALFFLRDNLTTNAVSPPAEVALATISPMLAKQNGHIASPLKRVAKRDRLAASVWVTGWVGPFLQLAGSPLVESLKNTDRDSRRKAKTTHTAGLTPGIGGQASSSGPPPPEAKPKIF